MSKIKFPVTVHWQKIDVTTSYDTQLIAKYVMLLTIKPYLGWLLRGDQANMLRRHIIRIKYVGIFQWTSKEQKVAEKLGYLQEKEAPKLCKIMSTGQPRNSVATTTSTEVIETIELTKFSAPGRLALLARFTASSRLFNCIPKIKSK
jgi:hypothetical protein